jgi:hypothetical protein
LSIAGRPKLDVVRADTCIDPFQQELRRNLTATGADYSVFVRKLTQKAFDSAPNDTLPADTKPEEYYDILMILRHQTPLTTEEIRTRSVLFEKEGDLAARLNDLRAHGFVKSHIDGSWGFTQLGRRLVTRQIKRVFEERPAVTPP